MLTTGAPIVDRPDNTNAPPWLKVPGHAEVLIRTNGILASVSSSGEDSEEVIEPQGRDAAIRRSAQSLRHSA
jgi:hypothetical protein